MTSPSMFSAIAFGGYLGSTLRNGEGSAISPPAMLGGPVGAARISAKFRIQLPVALLRFGMLTFIEYTRRRAKMASGLASGASARKSGGPLSTAGASPRAASARE